MTRPMSDSVSAGNFKRGTFVLSSSDGKPWLTVRGITDGTFGIDKRSYRNNRDRTHATAHVITHLKTGGIVRAVKGPIANAKRIVGILREVDWNFADYANARADERVAAVKFAQATGLCIPSHLLNPPETSESGQ